ncbi:MAG: methionyl-tRNA formyltransferase [Mycoplasmoidaceae bacterium]
MDSKKKIIFCGTPKIGAEALRAIFDSNKYKILFVITQPDKLVGRRKEIVFSPVKNFCIQNNIKFFQPIKISDIQNEISEAKPDLILTCAYGQFISSKILEIPKYRCINIHASLLPKYRGGAPIHWALINGEKETGISIMFMEKKMDSGNVIYMEKINIDDNDNLKSLFSKMESLAYKVVFEQIDTLFNPNLEGEKQDESKVTFGYNIKREDEKIDWNKSSKNIHNLIRGLSPYPGSFTTLDNQIVKIFNSKLTKNNSSNKKPGDIISVLKDGVLVKTLDNDLILNEIQFEGKKIIKENDIFNIKQKLLNKKFT